MDGFQSALLVFLVVVGIFTLILVLPVFVWFVGTIVGVASVL